MINSNYCITLLQYCCISVIQYYGHALAHKPFPKGLRQTNIHYLKHAHEYKTRTFSMHGNTILQQYTFTML